MANPMIMVCDKGCQQEFNITKLKTIKTKGGVDKSFFRCTHCNHEYVAYYSSAETVKLRREMKRLQKDLPKMASRNKETSEEQWKAIVDVHWCKVQTLKLKIKQSMDDARSIAEA